MPTLKVLERDTLICPFGKGTGYVDDFVHPSIASRSSVRYTIRYPRAPPEVNKSVTF